jgi:hypothetical protein
VGFLSPPVRPRPRGRAWREDPFGRVVMMVGTAILGLLLGIQYWNPNKRVIPVVGAILILGVAWRLSLVAAMSVIVFLLPYPKGTVFGSTNLALIMIVFVIWLLRTSLRMNAPARSSPLDLPVLGITLWYILSFYNIKDTFALERAVQNFELYLACVVLFYLLVNTIRTPRDLERLHEAQLVTALCVFLVAFWEAHNAGKVLIPGLLDFSNTVGHDFNTRDIRVGSSFRDYELLSEYCGITVLLASFLFMRAKSQTRRTILGIYGLFNLYTMFTTVTRGVIVALIGALPYLFYRIRRRLNPVKLMTTVSAILALAFAMNFFVAKFTNTGDMFERLMGTKVVHGFVPEAREGAWTNALKRSLVHPILGQGPYYGEIPGYEQWWPHNVYLFIANIIGFPGLGFYLMFLFGLWKILLPVVDDLRHDSYADSYLLIARTQMIVFLLNEFKIDFLRNPVYQFQVWLLFGTWCAGYLVARDYGVRSGAYGEPITPPERRMAA